MLLVPGVLWWATGCATPAPAPPPQPVAPAPTISLSDCRTFAIAPLPLEGPTSDPGAGPRLAEVTRSAIAEGLAARGYQEAPADQADLIVKVQTAFSPDGFVELAEERLMMISLHQRDTDALLWSDERGRSSSRTIEPEILHRTIIKMLQTVPQTRAR